MHLLMLGSAAGPGTPDVKNLSSFLSAQFPDKRADLSNRLSLASPFQKVECRSGSDLCEIYSTTGDRAVITISGIIFEHPNWLTKYGYGTSIVEVSAALDAVTNAGILNIDLVITSPGGYAGDYLYAFCQKVEQLRDSFTVRALVFGQAASAACWIACACGEVVLRNKLTSFGSVGTYMIYTDFSQQDRDRGIEFVVVRSGPDKARPMNGVEGLDESGLAILQERIDQFTSTFITEVARFRGMSEEDARSSFGDSREYLAEEAISRGLADRLSDESGDHANNRASEDSMNEQIAALAEQVQALATSQTSMLQAMTAMQKNQAEADQWKALNGIEGMDALRASGETPATACFKAFQDGRLKAYYEKEHFSKSNTENETVPAQNPDSEPEEHAQLRQLYDDSPELQAKHSTFGQFLEEVKRTKGGDA